MSDFISNHDRFCLRGLESYYQPMNSSAMKRQHRAVHRHHVFMQQYHTRYQQQHQQQPPRVVEFVHGNNYNFAEQVVSRMSFYSSRRARILAKWDEQDAMFIHYCSAQNSSSSFFSSTDNPESSYNRDSTQQQQQQKSGVVLKNEDEILASYTSTPTSIFEEMPYLSVPIFPSYVKKFPHQRRNHHNHHRSSSFVTNNITSVYSNNNNTFNREDFISTANSPLFGDCI